VTTLNNKENEAEEHQRGSITGRSLGSYLIYQRTRVTRGLNKARD
jgi:hypothetical protein